MNRSEPRQPPGHPARIETERLDLRPFVRADLPAFHAIWGDPEVIWWGANESLEKTRQGFESLLGRQETWPDGLGWLAVIERDSGELIGDVLLQPAPFVEGVEIGWHFRRSAWGCGFATEAASAVLASVFRAQRVERIYAIVATQNQRSLRIVSKLGMREVKAMEYASLPHILFAIDAHPDMQR